MMALLQVDDKDGLRVTLDSVTWEEHITAADGHPEVVDCLGGIAMVLRHDAIRVDEVEYER
jgi:hypothetical protein